jgi:hypothetical protein
MDFGLLAISSSSRPLKLFFTGRMKSPSVACFGIGLAAMTLRGSFVPGRSAWLTIPNQAT